MYWHLAGKHPIMHKTDPHNKELSGDFSGGPVAKTALPMQGALV